METTLLQLRMRGLSNAFTKDCELPCIFPMKPKLVNESKSFPLLPLSPI